MFEKSLDNNGAAPAAPTGSNQPENFDNDAEVTKLESEIDAVLATPDDDDPDDEDTVIIPKKKLAALETYKTGLVSLKKKVGDLKKGQGAKHANVAKPAENQSLDAPLTRGELYKANESKAVAEACKDKDINDNWQEVIKYYHAPADRSNPDNIVEAIKDAHILFRAKNPIQDDGEDANAAAKLAADSGKPVGGSNSGTKKVPDKPGFFPKKVSAKDWYPKPN
jgi:hypothetical protein